MLWKKNSFHQSMIHSHSRLLSSRIQFTVQLSGWVIKPPIPNKSTKSEDKFFSLQYFAADLCTDVLVSHSGIKQCISMKIDHKSKKHFPWNFQDPVSILKVVPRVGNFSLTYVSPGKNAGRIKRVNDLKGFLIYNNFQHFYDQTYLI